MAKVLNNMNVHVGDNLELNCDIIGSKKSDVTWKRFGFDLSAVTNKTKSNDDDDEYDDDEEENDLNNEIKFTSNGGIYIQNIEMRHAGNYTCQESSNNEVIQTHIINVHTQPILMITPEVQSKRPGEAVEIICHSVGEYIPTINWHKNEKPLDLISDPNKYTIHGNGTVMRINKLSFSDTGAYTCSGGSFGGHSTVSTLIIQNEPTPLAINKDEKLFVFHSNGISIYSSSLCQLIHEIRAEAYIPGTQETVCNQYSRRCTWGQAVSVAAPSDGLIYVSQPMMNRLIVLSIAQLIIIETIPTDGTPMELHHIPKNDQLWIVNFDIHRDETIKQDPSKSLQMIPDVRMIHVKHHPIHPERISGELMNFYVPPVNRYHDHIHDYKYGFVTHHKQRGFFKLDLSTLRYSKYVDLSIYDCVPEHIKFGGLCK
jgi:follistatin-related protein 5